MPEYDDAEFVRWNEFSRAVHISMMANVPLTLTPEQAAWLWKMILEKNTRIAEMAIETDKLFAWMPCGHMARYAVNAGDGTSWCTLCKLEGK